MALFIGAKFFYVYKNRYVSRNFSSPFNFSLLHFESVHGEEKLICFDLQLARAKVGRHDCGREAEISGDDDG